MPGHGHGFTQDFRTHEFPFLPASNASAAEGNTQTNLTASSRSGTTLTANASNNVEASSYTQLIASTSADAYGLWIHADPASNVAYLFDIATGGAASETDIISNVYLQGVNTTTHEGIYYFPGIYIPSGTRISARCQASTGSSQIVIAIHLELSIRFRLQNSGFITYGDDTSTSTGTAVTPANGSFGTWTQIGSTTSRDHKLWQFSTAGHSSTYVAEFSYGAAGGDNMLGAMQGMYDTQYPHPHTPTYLFGYVPSGSKIWLRVAAGGTTAGDWVVHGN